MGKWLSNLNWLYNGLIHTTIEVDEVSSSEDEAAAQEALRSFHGNDSFQLQLQHLIYHL